MGGIRVDAEVAVRSVLGRHFTYNADARVVHMSRNNMPLLLFLAGVIIVQMQLSPCGRKHGRRRQVNDHHEILSAPHVEAWQEASDRSSRNPLHTFQANAAKRLSPALVH